METSKRVNIGLDDLTKGGVIAWGSLGSTAYVDISGFGFAWLKATPALRLT